MALTDSLISYWKLDEASGDAVDVHGSNTLTQTGTVGSTTGKINNARNFERANTEYFSLASNASLTAGDIDFTYTAWVNLTTAGASQGPICGKVGGDGSTEYYLYYDGPGSGRYAFRLNNNSTSNQADATSFGAPGTGAWHFIVAWYDSTADLIKIRVNNGTIDVSITHTGGAFAHGYGFGMGVSGAFTDNRIDGIIDEVGFWKRLLTTQEMTDLYNSGNGLSYDSFGGGGGTSLMGQICY